MSKPIWETLNELNELLDKIQKEALKWERELNNELSTYR